MGGGGRKGVTGVSDRNGGMDGRRRAPQAAALLGHVLVAVVFFGLLTPLALVLRLFGRDRLQLRLDRAAPSYWIARTASEGRQTAMTKQF